MVDYKPRKRRPISSMPRETGFYLEARREIELERLLSGACCRRFGLGNGRETEREQDELMWDFYRDRK
jgi:hypothetical protein